jgi:hypothetical protein
MEELGLKNQEGRRKRYYVIDFRVLCDLIKPLEKKTSPLQNFGALKSERRSRRRSEFFGKWNSIIADEMLS